MAKGRKSRKTDNTNPKGRNRGYEDDVVADDMMDDEIDAFHKQRDIVPLDVNDDMGESDDDTEQPVFDFEEDEDGDDDIEDETQLTGLAAKIARQQNYLRAKIGGVEDEMHDDGDDEEERRAVWGRRKNIYYSADNVDYELQSSDEELPAEEEEEVLRLQKEKAKSLSMEDFGLEDVTHDDSDREPNLEEMLLQGKTAPKGLSDKGAPNDIGAAYEEVKKDLNALSREEQMDVVYSSAPELVGLLSELNDALEQLEHKVKPLVIKVREREDTLKGAMNYVEVKQLLLLSYCQAIGFYLLLKSEGQPVRDHPVIARLVEIKNLLDKTKQLDEHLPTQLENILNKKHGAETGVNLVRKEALQSNSSNKDHKLSLVSTEIQEEIESDEAAELVKVDALKDCEKDGGKRKLQNDQVGLQSVEMLKLRATLEERLKQKGIFGALALRHARAKRHMQSVNRQLETLDDFDDEAVNIERRNCGMSNGQASLLDSSKLSQLVTPQSNKPKVISGDDDLPKRDDIGERRRKHELRVLSGAGVKSVDDVEDETGSFEGDGVADMDEDGEAESDFDYYKQAEQKHAAKLAAKAEMHTRTSVVQSLPEILVDGKRQITYQIEKNKGLTRARKKLTKNPRKKYKLKHQKAIVRRKGQVREMKRPSGPYGGEATGINAGISRSIRFKN